MMSLIALQASTRILTRNRIGPDRFETTSEGGFRNERFRAPDSPAPSGQSAETHKTYAVSPKNLLRGDGAFEGEHTFTKSGRQRRATYATICQWIVDAWADISVSTVLQAFTKTGIITELPGNSSDTDSDNDERDPGMLDAVLAQLFNSDTQEEGFVDGE